ncbi:glycosyltransferase [Pseudogemmobacter sp. W21_MBD1_M6]|uniref:glycosyltransferase n=1 Tax=Pseudogemmobacter sp. W21_MBD1_M6 TaxID=3240271 RepID=UPI003F9CF175
MSGKRNAAKAPKPPIYAVLMTLYEKDNPAHFEIAVASIEAQDTATAAIRIYLCIDGPLRPYQDDWISANKVRFFRILRNPKNLGLAASLNILIESLGNETLVFRMDSDDFSLPDRFRKQAEFLENHPDVALVGCQAHDMDANGNCTGTRIFATNPDAVADLLYRMTPVLHPTFCMRRRILRDPVIRYPKAYLTEDLAFLITLVRQGHAIANHPEILFHWRTGPHFFARRSSVRRGLVELLWFTRALWLRKGVFTPHYIFPLMRFGLRCIPNAAMRLIYRSGLREIVMRSADIDPSNADALRE